MLNTVLKQKDNTSLNPTFNKPVFVLYNYIYTIQSKIHVLNTNFILKFCQKKSIL